MEEDKIVSEWDDDWDPRFVEITKRRPGYLIEGKRKAEEPPEERPRRLQPYELRVKTEFQGKTLERIVDLTRNREFDEDDQDFQFWIQIRPKDFIEQKLRFVYQIVWNGNVHQNRYYWPTDRHPLLKMGDREVTDLFGKTLLTVVKAFALIESAGVYPPSNNTMLVRVEYLNLTKPGVPKDALIWSYSRWFDKYLKGYYGSHTEAYIEQVVKKLTHRDVQNWPYVRYWMTFLGQISLKSAIRIYHLDSRFLAALGRISDDDGDLSDLKSPGGRFSELTRLYEPQPYLKVPDPNEQDWIFYLGWGEGFGVDEEYTDAVDEYTTSSFEINAWVAKTEGIVYNDYDRAETNGKLMLEIWNDGGFVELEEPIVGFRGFGHHEEDSYATIDDLNLFDVAEYVDKKFVSVSTDYTVSVDIFAGKRGVLNILHIPSESYILPVKFVSIHPEESEFLLPPGTKFIRRNVMKRTISDRGISPITDYVMEIMEWDVITPTPKKISWALSETCIHCQVQRAKYICSGCYKARYCGKPCQKAHRQVHRHQCQKRP